MSSTTSRARIICVDDEPHVIEAITDNLRNHCVVLGASNGTQALSLLETEPNIEVIMSDMRMPGMDGATVLARARALRPDVPRILLTGQADLASAIAAVNNGQLCRFLTKPCGSQELQATIAAATEHHRLLTSERVLLEKTLHGSVQALVDILAMTNPALFGRAARIKTRVTSLANVLNLEPRWQVEMAAMLQPIGYVSLPPEIAAKLQEGHLLTDNEKKIAARLPTVTEQLLGHIPRLEEVRAILAGAARPTPRSETLVELGAAILRVAGELDHFEAKGTSLRDAIDIMRSRDGSYSERVLAALAELGREDRSRIEIREIAVAALRAGMVFAEDVRMSSGILLVARGYVVTAGFIERVRNFAAGALAGPLRISVTT
jgi:response regulator RpfG family c-di-GMP phosphodiesterase